MSGEQAAAVWCHPGWSEVVGWIIRRVPDCDPVVAAIHAVRNAGRASSDAEYGRCLAGYVVKVARRSRWERPADRRVEELTWDPPEPPRLSRPTDSLASEAAALLSAAGIEVSRAAWGILAPSIDIAVDWWEAFASRTGLAGEELVVAVRQPRRTTGNWRLSAQFDGPATRPLVALLVGGDHPGRQAREACGAEAGLLYWSLRARFARSVDGPLQVPPTPVRRAWATNLAWIHRAVESNPANPGPRFGPTIAA